MLDTLFNPVYDSFVPVARSRISRFTTGIYITIKTQLEEEIQRIPT